MQNALLDDEGAFVPGSYIPGSISFGSVQFTKKSKPFMVVQNFSVCECEFQLSSAVHGVILSLVETFLEIESEISI